MKSAFFSVLCSILLLTACTAVTKNRNLGGHSSWSSSNPLSIPYSVRREQFEKGNLVVNPSFEDGRFLGNDQERSFVLDGWETVGRNIGWIEGESLGENPTKVPDGTRCLRIARAAASEVSDAEGVISDYMPVIPGNYTFSYTIRLENVVNNRHRLGVQLFDAIVVKVLFFDGHKQPVDATRLNPVSGSPIDNSNKSYSFSNFWRIDRFPWGEVSGRSYNYPFSEGDIPDRTRFVRLFFGLKGTGTLWLDSIYFGYSKWNFTALERFQPFFGQPLAWDQRLLPTPKHIQKLGDITYLEKTNRQGQTPIIVIPGNPAPTERSAADILRKKIDRVLRALKSSGGTHCPAVQIMETDFSPQDIGSDARLIFSIGKTQLYRSLQPDLPLASIRGKPQGYIIKTQKVGKCHVVWLLGETPIGSYYASTTAIQLFEADRFVYHDATIVDYPDFLDRPYVFKNWRREEELKRDIEALERMSLYKLNKVYFGYNRAKKTWYQPGDLYRKGLKLAGQKIQAAGVMNLAVMVNPYSHFDMEASVERLGRQSKRIWTHGSPESAAMLKDVCRIGLEAGASTIMLLSDDFVPHEGPNRQNYSLYSPDDKKRFINLQNAQAFVINDLRAWLDSAYPGTQIEFCPPWYSNEHVDRGEGKAEQYFRELIYQIPRDVAIVWTGPTIRSLSIDMADIHRYRSLIGRLPMIWDNTLYARNIETKRYGGYTTYYPGKVRLCNLFEPYDVDLPDNFQRFTHNRRIYTNGNAYSEVYKIKYATVADYEWNTGAYHPERSLWKTLCRAFGQDCAQQLIRFSDAYYRVYGICFTMETAGVTAERLKIGERALNGLRDRLSAVAEALPHGQPLLPELEEKYAKQKNRYERLAQNRSETDPQKALDR